MVSSVAIPALLVEAAPENKGLANVKGEQAVIGVWRMLKENMKFSPLPWRGQLLEPSQVGSPSRAELFDCAELLESRR